MKPVAICLDRLQAEVNAYMGILLPYLMLLKRDLQAIKREGELRYADPLIHAPLCDEDLLMATLTHPNHGPFMLKHVAPALEEDIKERSSGRSSPPSHLTSPLQPEPGHGDRKA
ncbi:hypothetical protein GWK47_015266 [Chionoecetes opilio]|uniref:Uncharacterized protein n=1 Tax=Chionoecetes opilio TaxID=41210 RepID=A0A8J4Y337_CHIOP|nr:hypothetical protein GWK47_015266 [Chionoecetes opilio]